jgi:hypothetical protein
MTSHWDEFSKSLAEESLPRRESLRRLGFLFAGTVLSPLGVGTAWARGADPCKTFCRCRNKSQQNACLAACNACNKNTSALCGSCGTYVCSDFRSDPNCGGCGINCAAAGLTCCGYAELPGGIWYCADLADDFYHCGSCGNACYGAGPNEYGACIEGSCVYNCNAGATRCNGVCTQLNWDPRNCGACGNVCPDSAPDCAFGTCSDCGPGRVRCDGVCVDLWNDLSNCGACGSRCPPSYNVCWEGMCYYVEDFPPTDF